MDLKSIEEYEKTFPVGSIIDGVVDGDAYMKSKFKIAWFLKESNLRQSAGNFAGYHIKEHYDQDDAYEHFFRNHSIQTWHPIIYCSYGILNGFMKYDDMDWIKDNPKMCDVIRDIAIINANKFPSKTGNHTVHANLLEGFSKYKKTIEKQIEVLQPQVYIFCGTLNLYKEDLGLTEEYRMTQSNNFKKCNMYSKNDKLFLDVYHPANRSMVKEKYIDEIIEASEIWANTQR